MIYERNTGVQVSSKPTFADKLNIALCSRHALSLLQSSFQTAQDYNETENKEPEIQPDITHMMIWTVDAFASTSADLFSLADLHCSVILSDLFKQ